MTIIKELLSESHLYEYSNNRLNVFLGNIGRWNEYESGGRWGNEISFSIQFGEHVGEFDVKGAEYLTQGFSIMLGRYGLSIWWRGREITGTDWDIPHWKIGNPDYA